jgi:hypothetical protein
MSNLWLVHRFRRPHCFDNTEQMSLSAGMVAGRFNFWIDPKHSTMTS